MNALIIGSSDRHLEEVLHTCGLHTSLGSIDDLATLAAPTASQPEVIVLDLRGGRTVPESVGLLKRQHPSTGVLIVAARFDPALMLEAMRAGVNEFVTEPIEAADLKVAIERVAAKRPRPEPGPVFAFVGAKGGVGTTTLAVNVAAHLAGGEASSALLIDLHVGAGDAALFLGIEPRFSVVEALENVHRIDAAFLRGLVGRTKMGLDLLASSERPMVAHSDARTFRSLIDVAARHYPYVVLDVPRADAAILDSLELATRIIVVANQELATVRSAGRMAAALRQRYGKDRVVVVVSRFDQLAEIGRKDIERVIAGPVGHVFPSNYRLALDALNRGRPLVLDNHNKLASAYASFARSLSGGPGVNGNGVVPAPERPTSLLGRLSLRT
jgi:pilus assembly protein CpaE